MKKMNYLLLVAVTAMSLTFCTDAPESDEAKTSDAKSVSDSATGIQLNVDTSSSEIAWIGTKVTGYHTGLIPIKNGKLNVLDSAVTGGDFVMDMKGIMITGPKGSDEKGNAKLLGHLKSKDFFEVDAQPEAKFEITGVALFSGTIQDSADLAQEDISKYKVTDPTHKISGNLTIKGITKNIEFPARITVSSNAVEALAKFNIDRSEWNIVYPGKPDDLIRNSIHMGISLKAMK